MGQILNNLVLMLAKIEGTFRTDALPSEGLRLTTTLDQTADVTVGTDMFTETAHGYTTGTGPVQLTLVSGAFATAVPALAINTDYFVIEGTDANEFQLAISRANALAGTQIDLTVVQVGDVTMQQVQSDAYLVIEPDFAPDITVLDREVVTTHIGAIGGNTGRKLGVMSFQTEVKSNDATDGETAPALGVLLRGCGFAQTRYGESGNTEETILDDAVIPINDPTGRFTYTKTTGYAGTRPRVVVLRCTTGGPGDTAEVTVYSPPVGGPSPQAEFLALAVSVPAAGTTALVESAVITTVSVTTNLAVGDTWVINLAPAGHSYEPVSSGFESLSMYAFFGGLLHQQTGSRGTFTVEGEAGSFATFSWTFTGDFITPIDQAIPASPVFEASIPNQVELANVTALGGQDFAAVAATGLTLETEFNLCAQAFSLDVGNDVAGRECINGPNSLEGAIITDRNGTGTFNPETELVADHPFWTILENADRLFWAFRVGDTQGNVVQFHAPFAQYTGIAYSERDNIRINDVTLRLAAGTDAGNDELRIVFC